MVFVCFCYPLKTNKGSTITRKTFDYHLFKFRAANETRTRDPQLGKLMLYQLSYYRDWNATKVIIRYNIRKEICCARFYPR